MNARSRTPFPRTRDRNAEIFARFDAGETVDELAQAYGLDPKWVRALLSRRPGAPTAADRAAEREARRDEVLERYARGESHADIGRAMGISRPLASLICREAGVGRATGARPRMKPRTQSSSWRDETGAAVHAKGRTRDRLQDDGESS